jgi:hypothetical protein
MHISALKQSQLKRIVLIVFSLLFAFSILIVLWAGFVILTPATNFPISLIIFASIPILTIFTFVPIFHILKKGGRGAKVVSVIGSLCLLAVLYSVLYIASR